MLKHDKRPLRNEYAIVWLDAYHEHKNMYDAKPIQKINMSSWGWVQTYFKFFFEHGILNEL